MLLNFHIISRKISSTDRRTHYFLACLCARVSKTQPCRIHFKACLKFSYIFATLDGMCTHLRDLIISRCRGQKNSARMHCDIRKLKSSTTFPPRIVKSLLIRRVLSAVYPHFIYDLLFDAKMARSHNYSAVLS